MEKVKNRTKTITIRIGIIAVLVTAVLLYFFAFKLKPTKLAASDDLIPFTRDGFVDSMGMNNTNKLAAYNDGFELYLDETTSYFKVVDKKNGQIWHSNPTVEDPWIEATDKNITPAAINSQKSTLQIQYFTKGGTRIDLNNYRYSINHPESIIAPEGLRTYEIKYIENGFQVLYIIADQEIDHLWFPKFIPEEEFENFNSTDLSRLRLSYNYDRARGLYYLPDDRYGDNMTRVLKTRLFHIFYETDADGEPIPKEEYGYTRDKVIELNTEYGHYDAFEVLHFEIAVQVILTEDGFEASLIRESFLEGKTYKFASITLYPLLGTAISVKPDNTPTKGYFVIPDGSGVTLEFNNGKTNHSPYRKRLYGTDLALMPFKQPEDQESIRVPLYGMIKENSGFAAIVTQGDAQTTLNADTSGRVDSYNKIYPTFHVRENELITLGTGYTTHSLNLWTQKAVNSDLTISYKILEDEDNNYTGVAKAYREYLVNEHGLVPTTKESSNLMIELIGAYDERAYFLGFPLTKIGTMTTFSQALKIVEDFKDKNVDLDIIYRGALEGGLRNDIQTKAKIEKKLGGNKGYKKLEAELIDLNTNLYLQTNIARARSYNRLFDNYTYTASRLNGSHAKFFTYHTPTGLPYSETAEEHSADDYVINPVYYQTIFNKFKKGLITDNIAHIDIGNILTGSYKKGKQIYKQDTLVIQQNLLKSIEQNMLFYNPLGFALIYADYAVDLPTNGTYYPIIDDHIPLLQLILADYVPYSSRSMNLNNTRSERYNFLKILESGSKLKYTLSHDDPRKLINTEYNDFMSTYYDHWIDTIEEQVQELESLKLYEGYLVGHERVAREVYKVTYSNGLEIYINYRLSNVIVDGFSIKSLDYIVTKEA